jgi:hypothetical protein
VGCSSQPKAVWYAFRLERVKCVPFSSDSAQDCSAELLDEQVVCTQLPKIDLQTTGEHLQHAISVVTEITTGNPTNVSKIGITGNPFKRWAFYEKEMRWSRLVLIAINEVAKAIEMMEAALIDKFKSDSRCLNIASGGDGEMRGGPPYFVYVVIGGILTSDQ